MKNSRLLLTVLAGVLILSVTIGTALAYFTDWTEADGAEVVHAGHTGEITETFDSWIKHVTVKNTSPDVTVFIRAKVFTTYTVECYGTNWTTVGKNEYTYYANPVGPGETAGDILNVKITPPTNPEDGDSFNVIVVYEAVPARYHEDGTAYADWTQQIETFTENA